MVTLLLCVLLAQPFAPIGICDDWANIWMAKHIAETGHLVYNGWVTAILGWQLYLGAAFIKLFGFSFTVARVPILLLSLICAAFMQRTFVRTGIPESTATIATLTLVLSPLFLPLTFIFMTDISGLVSIVICVYCCVRSLQADSDRASVWWLSLATLSSLLGGSVRQVAWLGALVMIPSAAWCLRSKRSIVYAGAVLWGFSLLSIALCMRWFHAQPYIVVEPLFSHYNRNSALNIIQSSITALVCLCPMLLAFVPRRYASASLGALVGVLFFMWVRVTSNRYLLHLTDMPFGFAGNFIQTKGINFGAILGDASPVIPTWSRLLLITVTFSALASFVSYLFVRPKTIEEDVDGLSNSTLLRLLLPFSIAYLFLVSSRLFLYDRYFLPLEFIATLGLLRIYKPTRSNPLPYVCGVACLIFAAYGIANMHDLFAFERGRAEAAQKIVDSGIPRTSIEGGFEYDGWTQLEQTGYVNIRNMNGNDRVYRNWVAPNLPWSCAVWFRQYTPSVHPTMHLSYDPNICFKPSKFSPVAYETWLPVRQNYLYILDSR